MIRWEHLEEETAMGKNNRAYKSAKRNNEISRLKKAEEKRRRKVERAEAGLPGGPPIEGITEYPEEASTGDAAAEPKSETETSDQG
jgi:hypothetical protein